MVSPLHRAMGLPGRGARSDRREAAPRRAGEERAAQSGGRDELMPPGCAPPREEEEEPARPGPAPAEGAERGPGGLWGRSAGVAGRVCALREPRAAALKAETDTLELHKRFPLCRCRVV